MASRPTRQSRLNSKSGPATDRTPGRRASRPNIKFNLDPSVCDYGVDTPLTDAYRDLSRMSRLDIRYNFSGPLCALYWIALCADPGYGHRELVELIDTSFPEAVRAMSERGSSGGALGLVSLGPGDGEIDVRVLRHLDRMRDLSCYACIDCSFELLGLTVDRVARSGILDGKTEVIATLGDFMASESLLPCSARKPGRTLVLLTGFTLGNFNEADLVGRIRGRMSGGDHLFVDARLHDLGDVDSGRALSADERRSLSQIYTSDNCNRFVFAPVEAATGHSACDAEFEHTINRSVTSVPNALNVVIGCRNLRTTMRVTGEPVEMDHLKLASTTLYSYPDLTNWFTSCGFDVTWSKRSDSIGLFLLRKI